VLAYLVRYTHRVATSNRRLIGFDNTGVTFRYKDYRRVGAERRRIMTLSTDGFIRRFLLHVLPNGFHRIRHYGFLASGSRRANVARARELHLAPEPAEIREPAPPPDPRPLCPCCGGRMVVIEIFQRAAQARAPPVVTHPYRPSALRPCQSPPDQPARYCHITSIAYSQIVRSTRRHHPTTLSTRRAIATPISQSPNPHSVAPSPRVHAFKAARHRRESSRRSSQRKPTRRPRRRCSQNPNANVEKEPKC
jgi:hypothetical protein